MHAKILVIPALQSAQIREKWEEFKTNKYERKERITYQNVQGNAGRERHYLTATARLSPAVTKGSNPRLQHACNLPQFILIKGRKIRKELGRVKSTNNPRNQEEFTYP